MQYNSWMIIKTAEALLQLIRTYTRIQISITPSWESPLSSNQIHGNCKSRTYESRLQSVTLPSRWRTDCEQGPHFFDTIAVPTTNRCDTDHIVRTNASIQHIYLFLIEESVDFALFQQISCPTISQSVLLCPVLASMILFSTLDGYNIARASLCCSFRYDVVSWAIFLDGNQTTRSSAWRHLIPSYINYVDLHKSKHTPHVAASMRLCSIFTQNSIQREKRESRRDLASEASKSIKNWKWVT